MGTRPTPLLGFLMAVLAVGWSAGRAATPLDVLRAQPKPHFRAAHTLPPLTRWGWVLPFDVRVELAERWGYALEMAEVNAALVEKLDDPQSIPSRLCSLAASDPKRYPLAVLVHRACGDKKFIASLPPETWCRDAEGKPLEAGSWKAWSPEAPDAVFEKAGAVSAGYVRKVLAKAPIAILLNGGEYALTVYGHAGKIWQQDPRIVKAKGERSWYDYISQRKAHQERLISDAVRAVCPSRQLYIYYYTDGCPHRNRYGGWWTWAVDYKHMQVVSDLPSGSNYYNHYNSGWTGNSDLLTQTLNSVAQQIAEGDPLSYNWVNGGWTRPKLAERAFSDAEHYMGYLKCTYAAGMIGGIAGYFAYPKGGFGADIPGEPPSWLAQMLVLARVHALFSHLEDFLRKGDLLAGPLKHRWSKDLPAYELPTGDPDARVIVRKHREREAWLIAAWAAGGDDRDVEADIPGLGKVSLHARACGSVYTATLKGGRPKLVLVDGNGMLPSEGL